MFFAMGHTRLFMKLSKEEKDDVSFTSVGGMAVREMFPAAKAEHVGLA